MDLTMNGRKAVITGGSVGLGLAMAKRFVSAGAEVTLVARREKNLEDAKAMIESVGGKAHSIVGDVSTADGCKAVFVNTTSVMGRIDILVNNAGSSQRGPFVDIEDKVWQADIDLKLFAAIRLCRLALPQMRKRKWGRVINILNTGAKVPPAEGAPTSVTRAAGMALTKVLAKEFVSANVLVNALLVGRIESEQWVRRHELENNNRSLEDFYSEIGATLPMGRLGTAEEFANAACFLASDQGSYISGAALNVDGGLCDVV